MNKGRKTTGGKYHSNRKKKSYERVGQETKTIIGDDRRKNITVMGGNKRTINLQTNSVNLSKDKKIIKTEILNVIETPQNKFLARQNRLMKGSIIETSEGKARITNRPSQEGMVNAVIFKE